MTFIKCLKNLKDKNKKLTFCNVLITFVLCTVAIGGVSIGVFAAEKSEDTTIWVVATETCYGTSGVYEYIEYIYDDDYHMKSKIMYDAPDGEQSGITNYTYDENDQVILEDTSYADGSEEHCEYTYDEDGNMMSKIITSTDDPEEHYEYTYDENGNMILDILYDSDSLLGRSTEYTYDEDGNMILKETTSSAGGGSHEEYIYDDDGNLTEVNVFSLNGTQVYHAEFICDRNGNVILDLTWTMDDSLAHRNEFVYDENNNLISDIFIYSNDLEERHDYTYYSYEMHAE